MVAVGTVEGFGKNENDGGANVVGWPFFVSSTDGDGEEQKDSQC